MQEHPTKIKYANIVGSALTLLPQLTNSHPHHHNTNSVQSISAKQQVRND